MIMLQSWQLRKLARNENDIPATAVRLARLSGATVWAFKAVDGAGLYGEFARHQWLYRKTAEALREVGVEVAAWGYHYGRKWLGLRGPAQEAKAVLRARSILGFDTYFVDAEMEWERSNKPGDAKALVEPLREAGLAVWFESWKWPSYHPGMRWEEWAKVVTGWAPQVYWLLARNAVAQLERSYREHMEIAHLPYWPVLPAFTERGWLPTSGELAATVRKASELGSVGVGAWKAEWLVERWPRRKAHVEVLASGKGLRWAAAEAAPKTPARETEPAPHEQPKPEASPRDVSAIATMVEALANQAKALERQSAELRSKAEALQEAVERLGRK